jgi:hypothetical protein
LSLPQQTSQAEPKRFMTRKQALQFLHEHSFPISEAYFNKICLPSRKAGPPVARWWGGKPLYDPDATLAWAESRCSSAPGNLIA